MQRKQRDELSQLTRCVAMCLYVDFRVSWLFARPVVTREMRLKEASQSAEEYQSQDFE